MPNAVRWIGGAVLVLTATAAAQTFHPDIPRAWDDQAVEGFEVPLVERARSPRYMTAAQYYALKVRPIYRSYPAYAKGREPVGYLASLREKEPEIIFDPATLLHDLLGRFLIVPKPCVDICISSFSNSTCLAGASKKPPKLGNFFFDLFVFCL